MSLLHCPGGDCPWKQRCERYTAEVLGRQDFFGTVPWDPITEYCGFFRRDHSIEQKVRERAYQLWQAEGRPDGRAAEHWRQAEALLFPG